MTILQLGEKCGLIEGLAYLDEAWDHIFRLLRSRAAVADEEEVYHYAHVSASWYPPQIVAPTLLDLKGRRGKALNDVREERRHCDEPTRMSIKPSTRPPATDCRCPW